MIHKNLIICNFNKHNIYSNRLQLYCQIFGVCEMWLEEFSTFILDLLQISICRDLYFEMTDSINAVGGELFGGEDCEYSFNQGDCFDVFVQFFVCREVLV